MKTFLKLSLIIIFLTGVSNAAFSQEQRFLGLEINENAHPEVFFFEKKPWIMGYSL